MKDRNSQAHATACLRRLTLNIENRLTILSFGALGPLLQVCKSDSVEVAREAAMALCHIALTNANRIPMCTTGILKALIALSQSGDVESARSALSRRSCHCNGDFSLETKRLFGIPPIR